jgi:hypothetical protein
MSEQQEYYNHAATNTYDTKLKARSFSVDNSSTGESSNAVKAATSETTSAATAGAASGAGAATTGAGIVAGVTTTSVVGVVVTTVVLVVSPAVSNAPALANVQAEITASTLSYSFDVTYIKAGSLEVRIENIDDTRSETYDLSDTAVSSSKARNFGPSREDSSSSSSSSEASSSAPSTSSSEPTSSSSVSSSVTQFQTSFEGIFENLLANRSYVFMVTTPINEDLRQTLYSATLTTGGEDIAPKLTVGTPVVDYDKAKLNVPVDVSDPSRHWKEGSLFAVLIGKTIPKDGMTATVPPLGTDGDVITADTSAADSAILTRTAHLTTPYASSTQTFDLTNYVKGYLIRLKIYGGSETNWQMLYETGLYY